MRVRGGRVLACSRLHFSRSGQLDSNYYISSASGSASMPPAGLQMIPEDVLQDMQDAGSQNSRDALLLAFHSNLPRLTDLSLDR